jgi:hypothetical protein
MKTWLDENIADYDWRLIMESRQRGRDVIRSPVMIKIMLQNPEDVFAFNLRWADKS